MTAKEENKKLKEMYEKLISYEQKLHEQNQRRIRVGIKCIFLVPLFFLFLMFMTGGTDYKIIFLVLWIGSLFGIAIYLVGTEYVDYKLQEKINEIQGVEDAEVEGLIPIDTIEEKVQSAVERLEARGGKK